MNTTDLGELLRGATAGVELSAGFTDQVLRGGRRRRLRRRIAVVASAVVVTAVAVTGTVVAVRDDAAPSVTDQKLTAPTRGDLADDRAFLTEATKVWQAELPLAEENRYRVYDDLRGEPHVVWAGNTPAGRAAVIVQQTYIHEDYWVHADRAGLRLAEGLVAIDAADGKLKLVGTRSPDEDPEPVSFYQFGPNDRTMLILDVGKPLYYSTAPNDSPSDPEGDLSYRPTWRRVQARDGVALVSITDRLGPGQRQRILAYHGDHPPARVDFDTTLIASIDPSRGYLHDRITKVPDDQIPIPNYFPWQDQWTFGSPVSGLDANWVLMTLDDRIHSKWHVTVWLPDRVVTVKETMVDREPSRFDGNGSVLTAGIGRIKQNGFDIDIVDIERVDHDAVLPVKYRIPDGGGWVVAQKGKTLAYRTTPNGEWQDAGKDAAHLPDNAVQVKVGDETVTL